MKHFTSIWEAIQNGTFLTVNGMTYRIDTTDPEQMSEDADEYCVITHDENTGEEQYWCFNEIESLLKAGEEIGVQTLCEATFGDSKKSTKDVTPNKDKPQYKNASFDLLDASGELPSRVVQVTEGRFYLHIDVEQYRINLQNYAGELELTVVDKNIDAKVKNEEIHALSLRC
jgi:hypothetical protein